MAKAYNYGIGNWNEVYANSDEERQELLIAKAKERIKSTEFSEMLRDYYSWRAGQTFDSDDILVKQSTPQDPDFDEIRRIQNMNEADLLEHMFEDRTWRTNNTVGIANDWSLMGKAADSQNYLRKQQWAHIQEVYDLMPNRFLNFSGADTADPRGTLHWLGDALYSVVIDPVNLIPIPGAGKAASVGATTALKKLLQNKIAKTISQETFEQAVKNVSFYQVAKKPVLTEAFVEGGITAGQNIMEQSIRIDADISDSFSKQEVGMSFALGFGLGGTLGTGMAYGAYRYTGRQFKKEVQKTYVENGVNLDGKMLFKVLGKSNLKYFDSDQVVEGRKISYWHWSEDPDVEPVLDGTFNGGRNKTHQGNGGIGEFWLTSEPDMWGLNMDTSKRTAIEFEVDEDLIYDEINNPNLRDDAEKWAIGQKSWERVPDTKAAYQQLNWLERFIPQENLINKKGGIRKTWKSLTQEQYDKLIKYFEGRTDAGDLPDDEVMFLNDHFNNPNSPLYKADLVTFNTEFRKIYKNILNLKYVGRATKKGKKSRWWRPELSEQEKATAAAEGRINPYKNSDHENMWVIYDYLTSMGYSGLRRNDPDLQKIIDKQIKQDPDIFGPKARDEMAPGELVEKAEAAERARVDQKTKGKIVVFNEDSFAELIDDLMVPRDGPQYAPSVRQKFLDKYTPTKLRILLNSLERFRDELPDAKKFDEDAYIDFGQDAPLKKTQTRVYHITEAEFDEFNLDKSSGSIWFSNNKRSVDANEVGASISGKGTRRTISKIIDTDKLKLANRELDDKYSTDELIAQGYDGVKFDDVDARDALEFAKGEEIYYRIFNNTENLIKPPPSQESVFRAEDIDNLISMISARLSEERPFNQSVWSRTHPDGDQLIWFDGANGRPERVPEGRGRSQNLDRILGNIDNEINARSVQYGKENLVNLDRTKLGDQAQQLLREVEQEGLITGDISLNVQKEEAINFIKKHDLDAGGKNPEDIVKFLEEFTGNKKKVITYMMVNRINMTHTFYSMTTLARRLESNLSAAQETEILKELDALYQAFSDQVRAHKNATKTAAQTLVSQRVVISDYTRRNVEEFLGHSRLSFEESMANQGKVPKPLKNGSIAEQKLFWNRFQQLDDINYVIEDWSELTAPNKWNLLAGWINANLLAGPTTQIINLAGTLVTSVVKPFEMYLRAADMYVSTAKIPGIYKGDKYFASASVDTLTASGRPGTYMTNAQQVRRQALLTLREATDTYVGLFTNIHHSLLATAKSFHQNAAILDSRHTKFENLKRQGQLTEWANSIIDNFLDEGTIGRWIGKVDDSLALGPFKAGPIRGTAKGLIFAQQLPLRLLTATDEFIGVLNYRARTTAIVNRIMRDRFPKLKGDDYKKKFNELFREFFRESEQDVEVKVPFTDKVIGKYKNQTAVEIADNSLNKPVGKKGKPLMPQGSTIPENDPLRYSQETKYTQDLASVDPMTGKTEAGWTGEVVKVTKKYPILRPLFGLHFIATPTNLIRWFLQRSPSVKFPFIESGLGKFQFQMKHMLAKGPDGKYLSPERAAEAEARIRMGYLMWGGAMSLAAAGYLNGGVESATYQQKRSQTVDQKRPPYSISFEVNGKEGAIAFNRMDPFSFMLGFAADIWSIVEVFTSTTRDVDETWFSKMEEAGVMAMVMTQTNFSSKFWMRGALDMLTQMPLFSGGTRGDTGEFDPKTSKVLGRFASKFIPLSGWWKHQNRTETNYQAEAYGFLDEIIKTLPVQQKLAPKRDAFGQKIIRPKGMWIMGGQWDMSPFLWHENTNPEVAKFLEEINFEYKGIGSGESELGYTGQDFKDLKMKYGPRKGQSAYDRLLELKGTIKIDFNLGYGKTTLPELIDKIIKDPNSIVNKSGGQLNYKENPLLIQEKRSRLIKSKTASQIINTLIKTYEKKASVLMQKEYGIYQEKKTILEREIDKIRRENNLY